MDHFTLQLPPYFLEDLAARAAEIALAEIERRRQPSELLTVKEAAEFLRCGTNRIYGLTSAGRLTCLKDGGRSLYRRTDLEQHLRGAR